jgi:hypothetical protein
MWKKILDVINIFLIKTNLNCVEIYVMWSNWLDKSKDNLNDW